MGKGVIVKILPKEFLSLDDVAILFNTHDYAYDLTIPSEKVRLENDMYDLINQKYITPLFHYRGDTLITISRLKDGQSTLQADSELDWYLDGYFKLTDVQLENLFNNHHDVYLHSTEVEPYWFRETEYAPIPPTTDRYGEENKEGVLVSFVITPHSHNEKIDITNVRYPLKDLENLFDLKASNTQLLYEKSGIIEEQQRVLDTLNSPLAARHLLNLLKDLDSANIKIQELEQKTTTESEDNNQLKGLDRVNAERTAFKQTGIAIANYLWSLDNTESIRTGDMVQQLKTILYNINSELLPDDKTVRAWLSDVAPPYARKRGRTPNNAPNKITLIMRK